MSRSRLTRATEELQPNSSAFDTGQRIPSPQVPARILEAPEGRPSVLIEQHRNEIRATVERFRATRTRIVGSVARGDDRPGSDFDVLVDFTDEATLLDEVGLRLALYDLLRVEVDVIASNSLRGEIRERLLSEAVPR